MSGYYTVWFTNMTGCAVGINDISWCVMVAAGSESKALDQGLTESRTLNRELGLPPHGLKVSEVELRRLASVQPLRYA